jgi:hypothetical protein
LINKTEKDIDIEGNIDTLIQTAIYIAIVGYSGDGIKTIAESCQSADGKCGNDLSSDETEGIVSIDIPSALNLPGYGSVKILTLRPQNSGHI